MTDKIDRRHFIKTGVGATLGAVVTANLPACAQPEKAMTGKSAETIFRGGTIVTMDDERRQVQAVAVAGGRIVVAGDESDVMKTRTASTKIVDLGGNTLMPSFIDAHGHFMNAPQIVKWANVSGVPAGPVTSIPDIIKVLDAHATKFKVQPGEWMIGYGYDATNLSEGREVTRDDLDPHFPNNPVMLIHSSNHGAVLNSKAFAAVKIDKDTKTPPGGLILRRPGSTEPAGLIMETAFLPVFANMPQPSQAELLETLDSAQQIYASAGVTTCQEGATHATDLAFLRKGAEQGRSTSTSCRCRWCWRFRSSSRNTFRNSATGP